MRSTTTEPLFHTWRKNVQSFTCINTPHNTGTFLWCKSPGNVRSAGLASGNHLTSTLDAIQSNLYLIFPIHHLHEWHQFRLLQPQMWPQHMFTVGVGDDLHLHLELSFMSRTGGPHGLFPNLNTSVAYSSELHGHVWVRWNPTCPTVGKKNLWLKMEKMFLFPTVHSIGQAFPSIWGGWELGKLNTQNIRKHLI